MSQQLIVMLQCLAKAKAGVEHNVFRPQVAQLLHFAGKVPEDVSQQTIIVRLLLHVLRRALHVHQHVGHSQPCHGGKHVFVHLPPRYVVNDGHPVLLHAHARHCCPEGVDRHNGIGMHPAHNA